MKVALVCGAPNSAIHQIFSVLDREFRAAGRQVELLHFKGLALDNKFDLVHFGFAAYLLGDRKHIECAVTCNLWSPPRDLSGEIDREWSTFDRIVVNDTYSLAYLGLKGYTKVTEIPMIFDHTQFRPLPPPAGEFSVGCFGNDYAPGTNRGKRFAVIEAACQIAGVRYLPYIFNPHRAEYSADPLEIYRSMHVYAHASFIDTDSLPVREALLCGRPVLTTVNPRLKEIVRDGHNGFFFDGSIPDLVEKIKLAQSHYDVLRKNAPWTPLWPAATVADAYWRMFEEVLDAG